MLILAIFLIIAPISSSITAIYMFGIFIVVDGIMHIVSYCKAKAVDYSRIQKQEKTIFCINYATANDGETNEYLGLGYKVIDFNMQMDMMKLKWLLVYQVCRF